METTENHQPLDDLPQPSRDIPMSVDTVAIPKYILKTLYNLYHVYWNETGTWDISGYHKDLAGMSGLDSEDYQKLEDACLEIEPHAEYIKGVLSR